MISPYVLRAIGWRSMDLECDGAVLVGGLEHELRHFGDPDEEHDVWIDPASARPYDVSDHFQVFHNIGWLITRSIAC